MFLVSLPGCDTLSPVLVSRPLRLLCCHLVFVPFQTSARVEQSIKNKLEDLFIFFSRLVQYFTAC